MRGAAATAPGLTRAGSWTEPARGGIHPLLRELRCGRGTAETGNCSGKKENGPNGFRIRGKSKRRKGG